jgi:uncharacterized protein
MTRLIAALLLVLTATWAQAQVFPSENGTPIIDDAELLSAEQEQRLVGDLQRIKDQTGAEVWVVTLLSTSLYTGGEEVADYARMLFAELGLTEVPGGKSALLLVFLEDRELRIEVGAAYSADTAAGIVDDLILPQFRDEIYAGGIEAGVQGMIGQLVSAVPAAAEPVAEPASAPAADAGGNGLYWILGAIAAGIAGIVALVKRNAAKMAAEPCPSCGKTGLVRETVTLAEATEKAAGRGERRVTCPHCGHRTATAFVIAQKDRAAPDKGAKAPKEKGGGGASGSW